MRFTSIPEQRRTMQMPRVAKIRLGIKKKSAKGSEYPSEVDYFVLSDCPEVAKVYGETTKQLPILLPLENIEAIIPHRFAFWGSDRGLKCQGDGKNALRVNAETGEMEEIECPGPAECDYACVTGKGGQVAKPLCIRQGTLAFMLPAVSMGGVYQIDTTSYHAIQGILDDLQYIKMLCGRVSLLTIGTRCLLYLVRKPVETHGSGHKEVHWPMRIELRASQDDIWLVRKKATAKALEGGSNVTAITKPTDIPEPTAPDDLLPSSHLQPIQTEQRRPKRIESNPVQIEPEPEPEPRCETNPQLQTVPAGGDGNDPLNQF